MTLQGLSEAQVRALLIKNWMTHDALWYAEVALKFGMAEASPMNLRVCRKLGQIELKRLMEAIGASPPGNQEEYQDLFEVGRRVFVPVSYDVEPDLSRCLKY